MSDYSNSVIYKIYREDISEFYIGSTKNEKKREISHKTNCNNENNKEYNYKVYEFIRANGGYDNWKLEVLEIYPCDNKIQLVEREQYYYDLLNPLLNSQRPYVSEEDMKEYKRIYNEKYREDNKDDIKEYQAKYREDHKKENKEYNTKYYEDNKDEINEHNKQKHICECGSNYRYSDKARHCKTKKHIAFIEKKNQNK